MSAILIIILLLIVPPALVAMTVVAIVNRNKENAYKNFVKSLKIVFSYTFIIGSLILMIFGTVYGVDSILNYMYPDTIEIVADTEISGERELSTIENEKDMYDMTAGLKIQNDKNSALVGFFTSISTLAVSIPLFIFFNKQVREKSIKE